MSDNFLENYADFRCSKCGRKIGFVQFDSKQIEGIKIICHTCKYNLDVT